jgi:hypothetical protein
MSRYRTAYPPEFRRQMVDLVRSGRTPEELAREFEPTTRPPNPVTHGADRHWRQVASLIASKIIGLLIWGGSKGSR